MTDHLQAVRKAGQQYAKARKAADAAKAALDAELRDAAKAGVPKAHLIEASGLARQTVFSAIRADQ